MKTCKKTFAFLVALVIFNGCNPELIPLKGKYRNNPLEITSIKSVDSTWLNIIQLFAENALTIKNIDRTKGIITSKKTSFINVYTFEDENGELREPKAWVVLEKSFIKKRQWIPKTIYSQWSIQIKAEKGTTKIKIDSIVKCIYYPNMFTSVETNGRSTGHLEELIKRVVFNNFNK